MSDLLVQLDLITAAQPEPGLSAVPLPVRVLDSEGGLIAHGVVSPRTPAKFSIPQQDAPIFVRLTWPSGRDAVQRVQMQDKDVIPVTFNLPGSAGTGWSAWAASRLRAAEAYSLHEVSAPHTAISEYRNVWMRLWRFQSGGWTQEPVAPAATYRSAAAKQIDFKFGPLGSWCLQLGGEQVSWRFVSLPGGSCRVLLTPNASTDPRKDPLKVVVTGFRPEAEALLEFLSRDSLRAAKSLISYVPSLERCLNDDCDDPIACVAAAYTVLRTDEARSIPVEWFDRFAARFEWSADAGIARCIVRIRSGLSDDKTAGQLLRECMSRGLPVFAEGLHLLQEAASAVRSSGAPPEAEIRYIERLAASRAWAGSALSFYGHRPDQPCPLKIVGFPEHGRPQKELEDHQQEADSYSLAFRSDSGVSEFATTAGDPLEVETESMNSGSALGLGTHELVKARDPGLFLLDDI